MSPSSAAPVQWLEVRVQADGEVAEAVNDLFGRLGTGGAVLEELVPEGEPDDAIRSYWIKTYLPVHNPEEEAEYRRRVSEGLWHIGQIGPLGEPVFTLLADADWAEAWKAHYHPLAIGRRLVIKPTWTEFHAEPGQVIVELDPGQAFGTGLHPSTQLCLLGLEAHDLAGQAVLDLGTGSGILAIAAARLGAGRVLAIDGDPLAVEVAQRNAAANGVEGQIVAAAGTLPPRDADDLGVAALAEHMAPAGFGLMLVNILAEVIAGLFASGLAQWMAPGGTVITAGIIDTRRGVVEQALAEAGLYVTGCRSIGDWVSIVARKPEMGSTGR
jgi:ribosomal protein L11 methyltransferase